MGRPGWVAKPESCLAGKTVLLPRVAPAAAGNDILPSMGPTSRSRHHVVDVLCPGTTVLAFERVPDQHSPAGKGGPGPIRHLDEVIQAKNRGDLNGQLLGAKYDPVCPDHLSLVSEDEHNRSSRGHDAERFVG